MRPGLRRLVAGPRMLGPVHRQTLVCLLKTSRLLSPLRNTRHGGYQLVEVYIQSGAGATRLPRSLATGSMADRDRFELCNPLTGQA